MLALRATLEALKLLLLGAILWAAMAISGPSTGPLQGSPEAKPETHLMPCWPGDDVSAPGTWDYCPNGFLKDT